MWLDCMYLYWPEVKMVNMKSCFYCSCRLADYQKAYAKEKAANVAQYQKALAEQVHTMILINSISCINFHS